MKQDKPEMCFTFSAVYFTNIVNTVLEHKENEN